jgi:hypothetical protein
MDGVWCVGVETSEGQIGAVLSKVHCFEALIMCVFVNRGCVSRNCSRSDLKYMYS